MITTLLFFAAFLSRLSILVDLILEVKRFENFLF